MQSSWRFRVEAKCFQWLECFNPAQGIAAWGGGVGEQSTPFLRSQILTLLAQTLPAAEQTNLSLRAIRNPLIVNVWFYQFLLHKHLIDLFEDARIIKQKKKRGGVYLVLIRHMQIPAVYWGPTAKHTHLPTAHQKASCWWKWLIHKIFVAKAKTSNGGFRLLMTKIFAFFN